MKHKRLIVTAMLLVAAALSYAQEEIPHSIVPNIIPPLPQSMIFDKYLNQQTLKIYDCFEGWLLVKGVDDNGTEIIGWLPQEMQCPNPWSTCP